MLGIVERPVDFVWSGHRELVRNFRKPFVDPVHLLLAFDETRKGARKNYLASIRAGSEQPWLDRFPGELPWWRLGRPLRDEQGRSTARERQLLEVETFIQRALDALGHTAEEASGRGKRQEIVRAREILMTLGVERNGLRVTGMVAVLGVRYNSACLWSWRGATRRQEDRAFAETLDGVDAIIASSPQEETKRSAENV